MCLILFAYAPDRPKPLVLAANRDEFYARPAEAAHWWPGCDRPRAIYGGRDLRAHGTWLAVSGDGRLAAVTNWTEERRAALPKSRGDLPRDFLAGAASAREFAAGIEGHLYGGFNFLAYDGEELLYHSNRSGELCALEPGVYGLTNTRLGAGCALDGQAAPPRPLTGPARVPHGDGGDWPKAVFGARALAAVAENATTDDLIELLHKPLVPLETPADRELAPERSYSPAFIHGAEYGTRASTAVILGADSLAFVEQLYGPFGRKGACTARAIAVRSESGAEASKQRQRREAT